MRMRHLNKSLPPQSSPLSHLPKNRLMTLILTKRVATSLTKYSLLTLALTLEERAKTELEVSIEEIQVEETVSECQTQRRSQNILQDQEKRRKAKTYLCPNQTILPYATKTAIPLRPLILVKVRTTQLIIPTPSTKSTKAQIPKYFLFSFEESSSSTSRIWYSWGFLLL